MNILRKRKGQTVLEYVILAAVVVGLAVYLFDKIKGPTQGKINEIAGSMNNAGHP